MKLRPGRKNPRTLYLQIGDALTSPWHLGEIRLSAQTRIESER